MSKRAEEFAKQLYPDPKLENYDDILVYRADRDNALMGRANVICVYEQAEKDTIVKIRGQVEKWMPDNPEGDEYTSGERVAFRSVLHLLKEMEEEL